MKKVLLVISHIGSGSDALCRMLDQNPRVQWFHTDKIYSHPDAVFALTENPHKLLNAAAIWADDILYDTNFCCPALHRACKFIYMIREPAQSLAQLIENGWESQRAFLYYIFRLRRICQMARYTPGAILLHWEDVMTGAGLPLVEKYLNLKEKLVLNGDFVPVLDTAKVPADLLERAEQSYNQHLYHLRELRSILKTERSFGATFRGEDNLVSEEFLTGESAVAD